MTNVPSHAGSSHHQTLGVELASFIIFAAKGIVRLEWITDNEIGNIGFAIERRFMDDDNWNQIAFLSGAGTFYEQKDYEYEDHPEIGGLISYRLRQTNADGTYNYSQVMGVSIKKLDTFYTLYQNFPNPFIQATTISFQLPSDLEGNVTLKVLNTIGDEIRLLYDREAKPGYYSVEWNCVNSDGKTVSPGVYDCCIETEFGILKKKMMKLSYNPSQN